MSNFLRQIIYYVKGLLIKIYQYFYALLAFKTEKNSSLFSRDQWLKKGGCPIKSADNIAIRFWNFSKVFNRNSSLLGADHLIFDGGVSRFSLCPIFFLHLLVLLDIFLPFITLA